MAISLTKCPVRGNLKQGRLSWAYSSQGTAIMAEQVWLQSQETAGHTAAAVRKQSEQEVGLDYKP